MSVSGLDQITGDIHRLKIMRVKALDIKGQKMPREMIQTISRISIRHLNKKGLNRDIN